MKSRMLAALVVAIAIFAVAPVGASAAGSQRTVAIQVDFVNPAVNYVAGIVHCAPPDVAGRRVEFRAAPGVSLEGLQKGQVVGINVDLSTTPPTITGIVPPPCQPPAGGDQGFGPAPGPGGFGPGPGGPGPGGPGQCPPPPGPGGPPIDPKVSAADAGGPPPGGQNPGCQGGGGAPSLMPGFVNRVWKLNADVTAFDNGVLNATLTKVLNVPKKFADQDDDLLDQDMIVLVARNVRVVDADGKKVPQADLADAENVRIQGKFLKPSKWKEDEDGTPTPTVRAKRIQILG